jgi:hypothetical protein
MTRHTLQGRTEIENLARLIGERTAWQIAGKRGAITTAAAAWSRIRFTR